MPWTDRRASRIGKLSIPTAEAFRRLPPCNAHQGLHPLLVTGLTWVSGRAPADGEDLAQVFVLLREALLQPLQLPQALTALVLHGAHVLDEVKLGFGGVVAQDAVVVAVLALHPALMLLQVLRGQRRGTLPWSGVQTRHGTSQCWTALGHREAWINEGRGGIMAIDEAPYLGYFIFPSVFSGSTYRVK